MNELSIFENFKQGFVNGTLTSNDPVFRKIEELSKLAYRFNLVDFVDDLKQETVLILSRANYEGNGSLDGYIRRTMFRLLIALKKKECSTNREEMPIDVKDAVDFEKLFERELSTTVKELLSRCPENMWWYIETIVEADDYISERDIAKKNKVSRYRVSQTREKVKYILETMEQESIAKATAVTTNLRLK